MAVPANLVNLEKVDKAYGIRPLLDQVSLGVAVGDRVGVVGRNGGGKTTLLRVLSRIEPPDAGRATHGRGLEVGYLSQRDELHDLHTLREAVLGGRADHEWASDARTREVVEVLLAGLDLERVVEGMSGGERRRASLAQLLLTDHDLLVLDEPTNHLDIDAIAWLAEHLSARRGALVVVTHDRWFLDEVCTTTWEVHDGAVDAYDGGYAAYVLAKAERDRQAAASEARRRNLVRKELAWLRRGPPARTSKPKFRIDAANTLIEDEPPLRDRLELEKFATARLGKDVVDLEHVDLERGGRVLLGDVTWRLGPGDRVGLVGPNGAGKSSILRLVTGEAQPDRGRVKRGKTVDVAYLSQGLDEMDLTMRVLESVRGSELTASSLLEGFGFTGDLLTARIGDLSGGERRRLQVLRLLLAEPNVLLLDEPTNDLDIETLNVLEDYLDRWPGTLVVVSHDRYFLERVTDIVHALPGNGTLTMLVGGVSAYHPTPTDDPRVSASPSAGSRTTIRGTRHDYPRDSSSSSAGLGELADAGGRSSSERRAAKKDAARLERQLEKAATRERELESAMVVHAQDYTKLADLQEELAAARSEREHLEDQWLAAADVAE